MGTIDDNDLAPLADRLTGDLRRPADDGYDALTAAFNLAVPVRPRAVVAAATTADVVQTVRFAADHGLRVLPHRTGHGAVPLDEPDGDVILLQTSGLRGIAVDAAGHSAQLGAGEIWSDVIAAAAEHGLAAISGASGTVGVAGYLTGAGMGPLNRTYGLSSDHVRAFEVVTGDGQVRTATAQDEPDLFWGLCGGKHTLGIVTGITLGLVPLDRFHGGALFFSGDDARAVLTAWREWAATLPEHASTSIAVVNLPDLPQVPPPLAGRLSVGVRYASVAPADQAEAELAPLRAVAPVILDGVGEKPYAQVGSVHNDPPVPAPAADTSAVMSDVTEQTIDALLAVHGPGTGSPLVAAEFRLLGGAMGRPGPHPDAFDHREAGFNFFSVGMLAPPVADAVPAQLEKVTAAVQPWSTGGILPNWSPTAGRSRVYAPSTRERLARLGDRYDPAGVLKVGPVVRTP